jgi:hypothetical protein
LFIENHKPVREWKHSEEPVLGQKPYANCPNTGAKNASHAIVRHAFDERTIINFCSFNKLLELRPDCDFPFISFGIWVWGSQPVLHVYRKSQKAPLALTSTKTGTVPNEASAILQRMEYKRS